MHNPVIVIRPPNLIAFVFVTISPEALSFNDEQKSMEMMTLPCSQSAFSFSLPSLWIVYKLLDPSSTSDGLFKVKSPRERTVPRKVRLLPLEDLGLEDDLT